MILCEKLWKIVILCEETYITTFYERLQFHLKSMIWYDKIWQKCKYDYDDVWLVRHVITYAMIWRWYMLVAHPMCLPYVWISQTAATRGNWNIYRFTNPNSRESTAGIGGPCQVKDKLMHFMYRLDSCSCYLRT